MIALNKVKSELMRVLKDHYAFESRQINELTLAQRVEELDIDSIALLELFLVVEDAFGLDQKLSDKIDMQEALQLSMGKFLDLIAAKVYESLKEQHSPK